MNTLRRGRSAGLLFKHHHTYHGHHHHARRFVFGFTPTSATPIGLQDYVLLYRDYEKASEDAKKYLRQLGYLEMIKLRNIDDEPLNMDELRALRYKLNLQFHLWVEPALYEGNGQQGMESALVRIVNGLKPKQSQSQSERRNKRNILDRAQPEEDEFRIVTPIFYHQKEEKAIIAKPAEKLISIVKTPQKQLDKTYFGDEDKKYNVLGTQWQKGGARFYDNDEGMDWDHVRFEEYEKKDSKSWTDWKKWGETAYFDENVPPDPNDYDAPFRARATESGKRWWD